MTDQYDVAVLVGSLRKDSLSGRVAGALIKLAPAELSLRTVGFGDLPLYNPDLETDTPPAWQAFRQSMRPASAVLFVTPEYNRSVPGALKNAIDVGSRPTKESIWSGKPAAIVSQSPGLLGGFGANHALRQSLAALNVPLMAAPEVYISQAAGLFDDSGTLTNESTARFLTTVMQRFAAWIAANAADPRQ